MMDKTKKQLGQHYHDRISERVNQIRADRGWSLRDLAPKLGMTFGNLGHKLRGLTAWSLDDIAAIENVSGESLIEVVYDTCLLNAAALAGTSVNASVSINRISLRGTRFHIIEDGEEMEALICDLEVAVLRVNGGITKTYYKDAWTGSQESEPPTCQSDDGMTPRADVPTPQARTCAGCPQNAWGSKINPNTGELGKACTETKRLSITPIDKLGAEPYQLAIPASSLKEWGAYIRKLTAGSAPYNAVVTRIAFGNKARLDFTPVRFLTDEEYQIVEGRYDEEVVKLAAGLAEAAAVQAILGQNPTALQDIPGKNPAVQARAAADTVR